MADMYDYLQWRSDLLFANDPMHEPDILIFASLAYVELPPLQNRPMTIEEMWKSYEQEGIKGSPMLFDPAKLLQMCAESDRYKNIVAEHYLSITDPDQVLQFSAVSFRYGPHQVAVAYRGTDTSLTGWQEDLYLSMLQETGSQSEAVKFLTDYYANTDDQILLTGHSKGGNLAQYAAIHADEEIQERIQEIWSLDGPGFLKDKLESDAFRKMQDRMIRVVPEQSCIGMFMGNPIKTIVIDSTAVLATQHRPDTWKVFGPRFVRSELSAFSRFVHKSVDGWLEKMNEEEKQQFIDNVFSMLNATGIDRFDEIVDHPLRHSGSFISSLMRADKGTQQRIMEVVAKLLDASGDVISESAKNSLFKDKDPKQ